MAVVIIAGMHRAGTSMVARLLNLGGLYLGEEKDMLPAAPDNPQGFWENRFFVQINEEILAVLGGTWHTPANPPPGWEMTPALSSLREKAAQLIHHFEGHENWGWKDPRNSITLPFWRHLIPDLKVIICLRNPLEVAASLTRRDRFNRSFGLNLWKIYYQNLFDATLENRLTTHYDVYFSDPQSELQRMLEFLGIQAESKAVKNACRAATPSLRNNHANIEKLIGTGAPLEIINLYAELCSQAGPIYLHALKKSTRISNAEAENMRAGIEYDLLFRLTDRDPVVQALILHILEKEKNVQSVLAKNVDLDDLLEKQEAVLAERHIALAERDALLVQKDSALAERDALLIQKDTTLAERNAALAEKDALLVQKDTTLAERDALLAEIQISRAWRFSLFLRKIRLKLIPSGSRRERFVRLLFKTFHIWRKTGTKALSERVKDRLTSANYYQQWILENEISPVLLPAQEAAGEAFRFQPLISIVMPVYDPPLQFLDEAIQSVRTQSYPHFELCIVDDASPNSAVRALIERHAREDARIRYVFREVNGHISEASNTALQLVTGEYFALLDHDDKLHPLALYYVAEEIVNHSDAEVIYSDEDKLDESGKRIGPYFKTDFNYDLLLSQNMISHLGVYKTATVRQIGGFRTGLDGSQDYDLILRVLEYIKPHQIYHIPHILYHWRISNQSAAAGGNEKPYAYIAAQRAISDHLERMRVAASVEFVPELSSYRVRYSLPEPRPFVDIILYSQAPSEKLKTCINSFLERTKYQNYGISLILDQQPDSLDPGWSKLQDTEQRLSIIQNDLMDSQTRLFNELVANSKASYICFLDERIQEFSDEWLDELLSHACQPGVGAVGPKILMLNDRIYSYGMISAPGGMCENLFFESPVDQPGYYGWAALQKSTSILSPMCFVVKKSHYLEAGGLKETLFSYHYSSIDFFLRLREVGLRNVLTPYSQVIYNVEGFAVVEIKTSTFEMIADQEYIKTHWRKWLDFDRDFNPNLSLEKGKVVLASPVRTKSYSPL